MEDERKLYPMRFCSLRDEYVWGSEEFKLADLGYRDTLVRDGWLGGNLLSEVMETYMDRVTGDDVYETFGRQFPLCVRVLKVKGRMPLRVHPDDEIAAQRYDSLGKEKLWYVLRAGKDACIMAGWKRATDASQVFAACSDGSVGGLLNTVAVHPGQCFHIAPGIPHAAPGELEILEIGVSSGLDFCLCDWGQEVGEDEFDPSLGLVEALDFIDYNAFRVQEAPEGKLLSLPELEVSRLTLDAPLRIESGTLDSFVLYSCLSGAAAVRIEVLGQTAAFPVKAGESILVPAECTSYVLAPTEAATVLLESVVPAPGKADSYINPEVPETVEE